MEWLFEKNSLKSSSSALFFLAGGWIYFQYHQIHLLTHKVDENPVQISLETPRWKPKNRSTIRFCIKCNNLSWKSRKLKRDSGLPTKLLLWIDSS